MRRALLISRVFPPQTGGSGRWFWELYRRMPVDRVRVLADVWPGAAEFDAAAPMAIERAPLSLPDLGGLWPGGALRYAALARRVRRVAHEAGAETVHAGTLIPEGWLALGLRRRGLPLVAYVHGEELEVYSASGELRLMAGRVVRAASLVVCNSENTLARLTELWPAAAAKSVVLHPGIDTGEFRPGADEGFRGAMGWSGRRVVLTVGRLQARKGHDRMIEALPAIRARVPDACYAVVGGGEEGPRLRELAARLGVADAVLFHGELRGEDLVLAYQNCALFALPNRTEGRDFEGFGIVLLEAQACGKPVVTGDSGGTRETLVPGRTGLVVDCRDPAKIADAVAGLLADDSRLAAWGAAARQHVVEWFDWSRLAPRAAALLDEATASVPVGAPA